MKRIITAIAIVATLGAGGLALSACSSTGENAPMAAVDFTADTIVIDVRTPEEFDTGHLAGALNINWQGAEFMQAVDVLDKSANYVIYCRSGNRAGQAIDMMTSMGFTNLTNLGSVEEAAKATGIAVVTD
ncbi:MAG: rhodanese-like domain-containing protein [Aurantimicrobium sp.]|jgi:rhodanese-related sulfurtransferase|nr:rhodanese-like domain-containing protein [Aurantimicrobium sp.]